MTTAAVMLVKDEADVIADTVTHLLSQVDEVIVADNLSTDGTRELLEALPVRVVDDREVGYYQSAKMTKLARLALDLGHEWVVPCDADEVWYSTFGRLADVLAEHTALDVLTAEMYDHVPTSRDTPVYRKPPAGGTGPLWTMCWRYAERGALPKVACRLQTDMVIEMGNHRVHYGPSRYPGRTAGWALTIRHFPYRSAEQFVRKAVNGAAAYAAAPRISDQYGGHWRGYGQMVAEHGEQAAIDWFHEWFHTATPPFPPPGARDEGRMLIYDPAPIGGAR